MSTQIWWELCSDEIEVNKADAEMMSEEGASGIKGENTWDLAETILFCQNWVGNANYYVRKE